MKKNDEIEKTVIGLINNELPKGKRVLINGKEIYFNTDLCFDSLKVVELFMECEEVFDISFDDAEIVKIDTVKKLIDKIKEKKV